MSGEPINALGFVEVRGLAAAIETADAMLKCAPVRLLRQLLRDPAQVTLTVEGGLGACCAAVDAGRACAQRLDAFVAGEVLGRPAEDTGAFVLTLAEAGRRAFGERPPTERQAAAGKPAAKAVKAPAGRSDEEKILAALAGMPGGFGAQSLARHAGVASERIDAVLDALCAAGRLIKRRGRYVLAEPQGGPA